MMTQICVHDYDIFSLAIVESVNICRAESQFACSSLEDDLVLTIDPLEVLHLVLGAIWGGIVHNDHFHFDVPKEIVS